MPYLYSIFPNESAVIAELFTDWKVRLKKEKEKAFFEVIALIYYATGTRSFRLTKEDLKCATYLFKRIINRCCASELNFVHNDLINKFGELFDIIIDDLLKMLLGKPFFMNYISVTLEEFFKIKSIPFNTIAIIVGTKIMSQILKMLVKIASDSDEIYFANLEKTHEIATRGHPARISGRLKGKLQNSMNILNRQFFILSDNVFTPARRCKEKVVRKYCHEAVRLWFGDFCALSDWRQTILHIDMLRFKKFYFNVLFCLLKDPDVELRISSVKNYLLLLSNHLEVTANSLFPLAVRRLCKLTYDPSDQVRISALVCIILIDRVKSELISDKSAGHIYLLIYNQKRFIATSAATFLHNRITRRVGLNSIDYINELADFHIEAGSDHANDDFLIDAMTNKSIILSDWESWLKLLMKSKTPDPGDCDIDSNKTKVTVRLMVSAVKQNITGIVPFNRISVRRRKVTESVTLFNAQQATIHFIEGKEVNLMLLCKKFEKNHLILSNLLTCFHYLIYSDIKIVLCVLKFVYSIFKKYKDNILTVYECTRTYSVVISKHLYQITGSIRRASDSNIHKYFHSNVKRMAERMATLLNDELLGDVNLEMDILKHLAYSSLFDILEENVWLFFLQKILVLQNKKQTFEVIEQLLIQVNSTSLFWVAIYFNELNEHKKIEDRFVEKLSENVCALCQILRSSQLKENHPGRKEMAKQIISNFHNLSSYVERYNGISCFQ